MQDIRETPLKNEKQIKRNRRIQTNWENTATRTNKTLYTFKAGNTLHPWDNSSMLWKKKNKTEPEKEQTFRNCNLMVKMKIDKLEKNWENSSRKKNQKQKWATEETGRSIWMSLSQQDLSSPAQGVCSHYLLFYMPPTAMKF